MSIWEDKEAAVERAADIIPRYDTLADDDVDHVRWMLADLMYWCEARNADFELALECARDDLVDEEDDDE